MVCRTPFGLPVDPDVYRMNSGSFRVHFFTRAIGGNLRDLFMVPDVAAFGPSDVAAGTLQDDAGVDIGAALQGRIGIGLQRHLAAAAQPFVCRDQTGRVAVDDPVLQAVRREAAEHDRVDCADPRAGEHGIGGFGDHRHVDRDAVALLHAARLQHIGQAADFFVCLAIGDCGALARVVAFPDDRGLVAAGLQVPVKAVVGDIGGAVAEPADLHVAVEIAFDHLRVGFEPVDPLAMLAPESFRIVDRALIHGQIAVIVQMGAGGPGL